MSFLSRQEVLRIHALLVDLYGGAAGMRDEGLLTLALAQPLRADAGELYAIMIAVAEGRLSKSALAAWMRDAAVERCPAPIGSRNCIGGSTRTRTVDEHVHSKHTRHPRA